MGNIETTISWFRQREGRVRYSMASRYGPNSYDCSSAVYYALRAGGFFGAGAMGNTDSLFSDLPNAGFVKVSAPYQRGDVFLWGRKQSASGKYGHTGMFVDANNVIHCGSARNGIATENYSAMWGRSGNPPISIWRHPSSGGGSPTPPTPDPPPSDVLKNAGELEIFGTSNGSINAVGWHFSTGKDVEILRFINAETGSLIKEMKVDLKDREDIKAKYPNVTGVIKCGFNASITVPNGTAVYLVGIRTNGTDEDELIFSPIVVFEQSFDAEVDTYAVTNEKFHFEILDHDKVIKRGNKILNTLSWTNELMTVPETEIVLPIEYKEYLTGRKEVKLFINNKVFHGVTIGMEEDKVSETITVQLLHVIHEWSYRQVSTNLASKNRTVNDLYSTLDFRYPNWNINYQQDSAQRKIDYVYSRQTKLEALTKTCELTDDLYWRVGFDAGRTLDIGTFGDKKPYTITKLEPSDQNIKILTEPTIRHEYENVINMATVYGEKSDSGMSSMSLREVYNEDGAQIDGFPVVILRNGINNERAYNYIEFTKLAPNNDIEYSVVDEESIAIEGDIAIEGTFAFNDLAPFNTDSKDITDEDRAKASKTAYDATVKRLKQLRRKYFYDLEVTPLPPDVNVGDRIRFIYDNQVLIQDDCSSYLKKVLTIDEWFYIVKIDYNFDANGVEFQAITLSKYLQTEREMNGQ